jgi:hypothetical protein
MIMLYSIQCITICSSKQSRTTRWVFLMKLTPTSAFRSDSKRAIPIPAPHDDLPLAAEPRM